MSTSNQPVDPDDFFADTRMTFGEHIEDLRTHLIRAIKGFLLAMVVGIALARPVLRFIAAPVERQLYAYWENFRDQKKRELMESMQTDPSRNASSTVLKVTINAPDLRAALGMPANDDGEVFNALPAFYEVFSNLGMSNFIDVRKFPDSGWVEVRMQIGDPLGWALEMDKFLKEIRPPTLSTLSVQEAFVVYFKIAIMTGFVLGSPWIFYQIWSFVAAGLYPHEKKYVHMFLPVSIGLFLFGVAICEFFVMDKTIEALLWFNEFLGMAPDLRLSEWLGFAIFMPIIFGISFQTPLVMLFVQRIGLVKVDGYRKHRRIIWFLMAVFAAVITPSVDPVSMMLLWIPMTLLFELGIWLCVFLPGQPLLDFSVPESEEMVEV
jgi:sec-independent protein translocase protein TatC